MELIATEEALKVLEAAPVAHLGMIEADRPYVTPMSFVMSGERILFRTMAGRKLEALRKNPTVCIEVSNLDEETGDWVSVIVRGTAVEVDEDDVKVAIVSELFHKYEKVMGSPLSATGGVQPIMGLPHVIAVEIEEITGMVSGRGFSGRTRPGRL